MISPYGAKWIRSVVLLCVIVTSGGCAFIGGEASPPEDAVTLRNLQIESVDGQRAVLLRLSRLPTRVLHSSATAPARITVQLSGPAGEGDLAEQALPQTDSQISQVRVEREAGELRVTLDLRGDAPPPYSVHEMADWIMIRLGGSES